MEDIFKKLYEVAQGRKNADPKESYVASLFAKGEDKILEKVGEEAIETILAHKTGDREKIVYETADLFFHTIVALAEKNIPTEEIAEELERRFGKSGHVEKSERP